MKKSQLVSAIKNVLAENKKQKLEIKKTIKTKTNKSKIK